MYPIFHTPHVAYFCCRGIPDFFKSFRIYNFYLCFTSLLCMTERMYRNGEDIFYVTSQKEILWGELSECWVPRNRLPLPNICIGNSISKFWPSSKKQCGKVPCFWKLDFQSSVLQFVFHSRVPCLCNSTYGWFR